MQKIAQNILECKSYDYCIMLPRHISQEYDELWVGSAGSSSDVRKIPRQLLMLPKDANFLVDVFFQVLLFSKCICVIDYTEPSRESNRKRV